MWVCACDVNDSVLGCDVNMAVIGLASQEFNSVRREDKRESEVTLTIK